MTRRSPARLLAPAALVASAVALFVVLASGGGGGTSDSPSSATEPEVTATATAQADKPRRKDAPSGDTYTVEPGDTPDAIAAELGVETEALLEANPGVEADALTVGQELVVP